MSSVVLALALLAGTVLLSKDILHFFQLESYQFRGYFRTLHRQWKRVIMPFLLYAIIALFAALIFFAFRNSGTFWKVTIAVLLSAFLLFAADRIRRLLIATQKQKKPFVVTPRVKRLYVLYALSILIIIFLTGYALRFPEWVYMPFIPLTAPLSLAFGALLALPLEKLIQYLYFSDARRKLLSSPGLIRIGITGSYGKTSVKFILNTILSEKYLVLTTPSSFNTPMGLSRIIRERLEPSHQVFIGEMGARHRKDICVLCKLVHPQVGILTSIGPQHLDTFKTLERIQETKYDLIRSLPQDGFAVFADDGGVVKALWKQTEVQKALTGQEGDDLWADHITMSHNGSAFDLHIGNRVIPGCTTRLLGKYSIGNILTACACAVHLELTDAQIKRGIAKIEPVEHRLQLLSSPGGITVIDDSFNSNPRGSEAALEVLAAFPGRRIIVTPGMVELGKDEDAFNHAFGKKMASCTDLVYLVGKKHTKPILDGLIEGGFAADHVKVCADLNEATALLHQTMQTGDVILYENDLPDHYDEK